MRRPLITELKNPRWVYHPTKEAMAVEAEEAEELYNQGWYDHPVTADEMKAESSRPQDVIKFTKDELEKIQWGKLRKLHKSVTGRDERKMKKQELINEILTQDT